MEKKPLYLDNEGYKQLKEKIAELENQLREHSSEQEIIASQGTYDVFRDCHSIRNREAVLIARIHRLYIDLQRVVLVEKEEEETELVDLGDTININKIVGEVIEPLTIKLVGNEPDIFAPILETSLNSPIGAAIYKKSVGSMHKVTTKDSDFLIEIVSKLDLGTEKEKMVAGETLPKLVRDKNKE